MRRGRPDREPGDAVPAYEGKGRLPGEGVDPDPAVARVVRPLAMRLRPDEVPPTLELVFERREAADAAVAVDRLDRLDRQIRAAHPEIRHLFIEAQPFRPDVPGDTHEADRRGPPIQESAMLHVTNGDSAGSLIERSGVEGEVLPWRDVLHEGPVPAGLDAAELRRVRASFIAGHAGVEPDRVLADFEARDARLERAIAGEQVALWFEHDLYDQLQLVQILDCLAGQPGIESRLSLICIDSFRGVERFIGLGQLSPAQIASLWERRVPVTAPALWSARDAWAAFRAPEPTRLEALLAADSEALPFLGGALLRHLEQFPAVGDGLCRTERQILGLVVSGVRRPHRIFQASQELEAAPFLGDTTFWSYLEGLCSGPEPLLRTLDGAPLGSGSDRAQWERELAPTPAGEAVRAGRADWVALQGGVDRWLGGVHLSGSMPRWRWSPGETRLVECA